MAKRGGWECKNILRMWYRRSYGEGGGFPNDQHTVEMSDEKGKNYISSHNFFLDFSTVNEHSSLEEQY